MSLMDKTYCGLPWKAGGRSREGLDCAGLAKLWLEEQMDLHFTAPPSGEKPDVEKILGIKMGPITTLPSQRGELVFFRHTRGTMQGKVGHVAIYLGHGKYLHILCGCESRIDTTQCLLNRVGLIQAGVIPPTDAVRLCQALSDSHLGADPATGWAIAMFVISIALSVASAFLRPKLGQRNQTGRYGFDSLATANSSELPLPDVLGNVVLAGNSPFQSMIDGGQVVTDQTVQGANKVIILSSGPISGFDQYGIITTINGTLYDDAFFYATGPNRGIFLNPTQTKAQAVTGTIGSDNNRSSFTLYPGAHDITVPLDIRAQYDRDFPIYGFSGAAYLVFKLINSIKFSGFNLNTSVTGRLCRQYTNAGFTTTSVVSESMTGIDGVQTRFKLANFDIAAVTLVTDGTNTYTEMSATNQTGFVYRVNYLKGYLECPTAPANATTLAVTYTYYPRVWTNCPADHLVYLLTERGRGKGLDPSKINWQSAVDLQTYCNASVIWVNASGTTTAPRYTCNYALDVRKPIQEHITAVLDACYAYLFLSGGQFYLKARKSETSVMDFDTTNIIAGSFSSTLIDRTQIANRIHVFFRDTHTYNVENEIIRDDGADQDSRAGRAGDNGIVESVLHLPGIDNPAQAERYSEQILRENVNTRWTAQWTTSIKGLAIQPGDVVTVTHPAQPSWSLKLFRVEEISYDEHDQLILKSSEYFDGAYI